MTTGFGRYELLGPIASGGMATVHLARVSGEGGFERYVAVKRMLPTLESDESFVAMFLDEARLAARIRHANVVGVLDLDRNEHGPFLVMDFVDGPSLNTLLKHLRARRQRLPLEIALRIMLDVLAGLHAAHELADPAGRPLGLVHRDVSPANVLVGRDGVARITDFGVARAETRLAQTDVGQLKGKLPYMAPEQLRGAVADRRSDVYAAGCVFWELVALRRAIQGDDHAAMIAAVLAGPTSSLAAAGFPLPPELDSAVMAALAPVERRFPSAREFADALEATATRSGVSVARADEVAQFVSAHHPSIVTPDLLAPFRGFATSAIGEPGALGAAPGDTAVTHVADSPTLVAPHAGRRLKIAITTLAAAGVLGAGLVAGSRLGRDEPTSTSDRGPASREPFALGEGKPPTSSAASDATVPPVAPSTAITASAAVEGGARASAAPSATATPPRAPTRPPAARVSPPSAAAGFDPKSYRPRGL